MYMSFKTLMKGVEQTQGIATLFCRCRLVIFLPSNCTYVSIVEDLSLFSSKHVCLQILKISSGRTRTPELGTNRTPHRTTALPIFKTKLVRVFVLNKRGFIVMYWLILFNELICFSAYFNDTCFSPNIPMKCFFFIVISRYQPTFIHQ